MDNLVGYILDNVKNGEINRIIGLELLKKLKQTESDHRHVAVVGMALRFPKANTVKQYWNNLKNGTDCSSEFPLIRKWCGKDLEAMLYQSNGDGSDGPRYVRGGYLDDIDSFDYNFFNLTYKEALTMDPAHRLFLEVGYHAVEDGGYGGDRINGRNIGVFAGYNAWPFYSKLAADLETNFDALAGGLPSMIPARLSSFLNLFGPSIMIDTACSSSLSALHLACKAIKSGDCEMAVVGGVNIRLLPYTMQNDFGLDAVDGKTKAFDDSANGTVWGEGAAAVLLKPLCKAESDHDHIYAVIRGTGSNHDGATSSITAPNVKSQEELLLQTWKNAQVSPDDIGMIEAHGTGTLLGDIIEANAITNAFRRNTRQNQFCAVGSVKTNIGHLDAASGMAGFIKAVLSLSHKQIPQTLNFELPNANIDFINSPVYIAKKLEEWDNNNGTRKCGVSSFGMSGTNVHVILEEYERSGQKSSFSSGEQLFVLSAKTQISLMELIKQYYALMDDLLQYALSDICYTAAIGRGHYEYRLGILSDTHDDLQKKLLDIIQNGLEYVRKDIMYGFKEREVYKAFYEPIHQEDALSGLRAACQDYVTGADPYWAKIMSGSYIVPLPIYPYDKKRCWLDIPSKFRKNLRYNIRWLASAIKDGVPDLETGNIIVVHNEETDACWFIDELKVRGIQVTNLAVEGLSVEMMKELTNSCDCIVYINKECGVITSSEHLDERLEKGLYSFFGFIKSLNNSGLNKNIRLLLVANNINDVLGMEEIYPLNAVISGLGKVVSLEMPYISCRCVDIDENMDAKTMVDEICYNSNKYCTAYRQGVRYEEMLDIATNRYLDNDFVRENGVYVVLGGFGGIGLEISKYLSSLKPVSFIMINRSEINEDNLARQARDNPADSAGQKLGIIKEIRENGSSVEFVKGDVSDCDMMRDILAFVRNKYGGINGVIHSAGTAGNGLLANKNLDEIKKMMRSKVHGTWIIDQHTRDDELDFLLLFSSGASIFGDVGHGDYMAANSYLDAYEAYRNRQGRNTLLVNWTGWKEIGMAKDLGVNVDATFKSVMTDDALKSFHEFVHGGEKRVLIGELNHESPNLRDLSKIRIPFHISEGILDIVKAKAQASPNETVGLIAENEVILSGMDESVNSSMQMEVARAWADVLGINELSVRDNFFEIGGDSIKAVQIVIRLKDHKLPNNALYQWPTISELSRAISCMKESFCENSNKTILNIKPFSGVMYKDCFYNALFTVINYYHKDIAPILSNEVIIYCMKEDAFGNNLSVHYESIEKLDDILGLMHLTMTSTNDLEDIVGYIRSLIDKDMPVIVRVDCYYEPVRADMYLQTHWPHTLLVYGYDDGEGLFHIFEQENLNSNIYKAKTIVYEDLIRAIKGYSDLFHEKEQIPIMISLENGGELQQEPSVGYWELLLCNLHKYHDEILQGFNYIKIFHQEIIAKLKTSNNWIPDGAYSELTQVLKAKAAEAFRFRHLYKESATGLEMTERIFKEYNHIIYLLGRYKYTKKITDNQIDIIDKVFKNIFIEEQKLFNEMINRRI